MNPNKLPELLSRTCLDYAIGIGLKLGNYEQIELEAEDITKALAEERLAKKAQSMGCEAVVNYRWSQEILSIKSEGPKTIRIEKKYYASGTGLKER